MGVMQRVTRVPLQHPRLASLACCLHEVQPTRCAEGSSRIASPDSLSKYSVEDVLAMSVGFVVIAGVQQTDVDGPDVCRSPTDHLAADAVPYSPARLVKESWRQRR